VLHKSQSAVTYAVQKIEQQLQLKVFETSRVARHVLTAGRNQVLYRRAQALLEEAGCRSRMRPTDAFGRLGERNLALAVETIFPTWLLLQCFARFALERPEMRIELYETVLSGTEEALLQRRVALAIGSLVPPGFVGDALMPVRFVAAAHPQHPLHGLGRQLTVRDLRQYRQLVIRDSGAARSRNAPWLGAEQRWTFSNKATSIRAALSGLGFAWFAEDTIRAELDQGLLKPLPLREGAEQWAQLYLIHPDRDQAGPGAMRLAEIIRNEVKVACRAL
jgi:DNA-binding transcriptional LysR family regulator